MAKKVDLAKSLSVKSNTISALMHGGITNPTQPSNTQETNEKEISTTEIVVENKISPQKKKQKTVTEVTKNDNNSFSSNENYKHMLNLRKSDKEQDEEIKRLLYEYSTNYQVKTVTENNKIKNIEYIDNEKNSVILGEVMNIVSDMVASRNISDNEKMSLFTQLMIDFITDRLKFIARTELLNSSSPKYIEECMNNFFKSAPDIDEELKKEFIDEGLAPVIQDVENFVERKTFYMKAISSEAIKTYCKMTDTKLYDALNKFILDGLANEDMGKECIDIAKKTLYTKGCLKQTEITKSSKKLKKYDI